MKNLKNLFAVLCMALIAACFHATALGQSTDKNRVANMTANGSSVRWDVAAANAGLTLTISAPDGQVFRKEFRDGSAPNLSLLIIKVRGYPTVNTPTSSASPQPYRTPLRKRYPTRAPRAMILRLSVTCANVECFQSPSLNREASRL